MHCAELGNQTQNSNVYVMGKLIRINQQKSTSLKDLNKFSLCNSRSVACYMINYMLPTDGCAFYLNVGHVIVVKNLVYE